MTTRACHKAFEARLTKSMYDPEISQLHIYSGISLSTIYYLICHFDDTSGIKHDKTYARTLLGLHFPDRHLENIPGVMIVESSGKVCCV